MQNDNLPPAKLEPLTFVLRFHRAAILIDPETKEWVEDESKTPLLPEFPPGWDEVEPKYGDHPTINAIADRLNIQQERGHFVNYFFFPEIPEKVDA